MPTGTKSHSYSDVLRPCISESRLHPLYGDELVKPLGSRKLKLSWKESLDLITGELLSEVWLAIDFDIVDP